MGPFLPTLKHFRYAKPGFINPQLLKDQDISLENLLEDEAVGMAFPVDLCYFDHFPLIFGEDEADIAGQQHPQNPMPECRESLRPRHYKIR